ncbi:MAG: lipocalin-like domain-containing protein [Alphaproteobacteria bacterium]
MANIGESLVGSWHLLSYAEMQGDKITGYPYGEAATGRIFYTAEGTMAAFLNHEALANTPPDEAASFDKVFCYAGDYSVKDDLVFHEIDNASLPFVLGITLVRKIVSVSDQKLVLEADIPGRDDAVWHLTWQRD